jgi:predicted helicase
VPPCTDVAHSRIVRQAHNTAGRPTKFAAFGLDDTRLRARRRLFLTATPKRFERDVASGRLTVHSMDDEGVYGPVVYRLGWGPCRRMD